MTTPLEFEDQIASTSSNLAVNYFQRVFVEGTLVLRPAFQRNLVWNEEQQSFLIDTILRGLPIPEIYIQTNVSADGVEETIVVDGQQRITACLKFLNGELRLVGDQDLDARWSSKTFAEIGGDLQQRFRSFKLIVRELPQRLNEDVLREVFRRLNKTVEPLEPQELRHAAYTGPFIKFVELAAEQPVLRDTGVFSAKDYLRRRSDEFVAEVSFAILIGAYPNKKEGLDELFLTLERQGLPSEALADLQWRFGRILVELPELIPTLRRTRFRNKSDFYSLLVFLARNAELLPFDRSHREQFTQQLVEFSALVNDIKRLEGEGRSTDHVTESEIGVQAARYLRAVERAASDRLSRVRREDALADVLGPVLEGASTTPLGEADARWTSESQEDADEGSGSDDDAAERRHVEEVLLSDGTTELGSAPAVQ